MKTEFTVSEDGFHGQLFLPEQDRFPGRALMVWSGSDGMFSMTCRGARCFAREGISTLALAFYNVPGLPDKLVNVPMESVEHAAEYLKEQKFEKVAVWGISTGAQLAVLSGIYMPELITCVMAASPTCISTQGMDTRTLKAYPGSLFTWRGRHIPCVSYNPETVRHGKRLLLQYLLRHHEFGVMYYYDELLADIRDDQILPAEKINGPVLLISGGMDSMWPSVQSSRLLMRRMEEHGHPFEHRHLNYIHGSHYMLPLRLKTAKLFKAERRYPEDCAQYRQDMMREMMAFLERW